MDEVREDMHARTSREVNEISAALAKAQTKIKNATLNKVNPHFKSRYADLAAIRDAVVPPLAENGIAVTQMTAIDNGRFILFTRLTHNSGQWIESTYPLPMAMDKPQAMGSALTYARRYSLAAITGVSAEEDDDANAAQDEGEKPPANRRANVSKGNTPAADPIAITAPDEPGLIAVPSSDNMAKVWDQWSRTLAGCLDNSATIEEASAWMEENKQPLANLALFSETGKKRAAALKDKCAQRVSDLSQAPVAAE